MAERATGLADPAQGGAALPMRELMDEFLHREGLTPPADWRPPQRRDRPPPPGEFRGEGGPLPPRAGLPPPERADAPPPVRPRAPGPDGLTQRIQVVDPQGRHLGGPRFPPERTLLQEPVRVWGQLVAIARMLPSVELAGVDARFLRRQYTGLALAAGGSLAAALPCSVASKVW